MFLISGLGNPGEKHLMNRHNMGFMVLDALAACLKANPFKKEKHCLITQVKHLKRSLLLVKPQKFMNRSGEALFPLIQFYSISKTEELLVIHDDVDQKFTFFRYQKDRGDGGHNGVKNIHETLKTKNYFRLKIGVNRPPPGLDTAQYVLKNFSREEKNILPKFIAFLCESLICFLEEGYTTTLNQFQSPFIFSKT